MKNKIICLNLILTLLFCPLPKNIKPKTMADDLSTNTTLETVLNSYSGNESYFTQLNGTIITEDQLKEIESTIIKYIEENSSKNLSAMTDFEKLCLSMRWIKSNITNYTQDLENNLAYTVFTSKKAVCQGYANLFKVFAHILSVPCLVVNGDTNFGAHAWNYFYDNTTGRWYICDPTNTGTDDFEKIQDINTQNYYQTSFIPYTISPYLYKDENFIYWYQYNNNLKISGITVEVNENAESVSIPEYIPSNTNLKIEYLISPINQITTTNKLKSIKIPKSIKYIENTYFSNYSQLEKIALDNNENYIQKGDMIYSKDFSQIFIPKNIKEITYPEIKNIDKNSSLSNLQNLTSITFSEGTESIDSSSIENCPNLQSIYISKSIKSIDNLAFSKINPNAIIISDSEIAKKFAENNNFNFKYQTINDNSNNNDSTNNEQQTPNNNPNSDKNPETPNHNQTPPENNNKENSTIKNTETNTKQQIQNKILTIIVIFISISVLTISTILIIKRKKS